ncbi:hypothetical protein FA13DRAFT_1019857 [Coprinellus micaceus]|uniref:Srp40 C-terminal domain-containing protein n=1 Tax=Coprinellus micaceus TaxID=71717 RepID=A0A4Y7SXH8_COPMI|nr:hypothetical protein FA13DRAFT_1019857 [Coprinellus micaceus]
MKDATKESSSSSSSSSSDSSDSSSESEDEEKQRATKKRRTDAEGSAATTAVVADTPQSSVTPQPQQSQNDNKNGHGKRKASGERFQRVKADQVNAALIMNNAYEAKIGPQNDYGLKAHQDLIVTRGAGFRKEKNKKKKGSYRGGEITMTSHSFKFTD